MRLSASDIECGGVLTIVKVGDCLQNAAAGIERPWLADPTGGVPMRIRDDLCVNEVPGGDPLVQGLAKSSGSRHVCKWSKEAPLVISRIYGICVMQQVCLLRVKPSKRWLYNLGRDGKQIFESRHL